MRQAEQAARAKADVEMEDAELAQREPPSKKNMKLVAIKKQLKPQRPENGIEFTLIREIKILQEMDHPNIVKMLDVFQLKGLLYFALEFCPVDLGELVRSHQSIILQPEHIKCIMQQIMSGLSYMHSNFVMHRDLHTSNILVRADGCIKIIDFNSSMVYGSPNRAHSQQTTTLNYRSPELLLNACYYGPPTDIWSAGCIFAELFLRERLFTNPFGTQVEQLSRIFSLRGTITNENWPEARSLPDFIEFSKCPPRDFKKVFPMMSPNAVDLLDKMLQLDPNMRPTAAEALRHPYFTSEDPPPCQPSELPIRTLLDKQIKQE